MFQRHCRDCISKPSTCHTWSFTNKIQERMDVSLKQPFLRLFSGGMGVGNTEFIKNLFKSKLTAPPPERIIWCYANHQQELFEEFMKMNVEYVDGIPEDMDKYFNKDKRNLITLDDLMDKASKNFKITVVHT